MVGIPPLWERWSGGWSGWSSATSKSSTNTGLDSPMARPQEQLENMTSHLGLSWVIRLPPVIIHLDGIFHDINPPAIKGYPNLWTPPFDDIRGMSSGKQTVANELQAYHEALVSSSSDRSISGATHVSTKLRGAIRCRDLTVTLEKEGPGTDLSKFKIFQQYLRQTKNWAGWIKLGHFLGKDDSSYKTSFQVMWFARMKRPELNLSWEILQFLSLQYSWRCFADFMSKMPAKRTTSMEQTGPRMLGIGQILELQMPMGQVFATCCKAHLQLRWWPTFRNV